MDIFTDTSKRKIISVAEFIQKNKLDDDFGYSYEAYYRNKKLYDGGIDAGFIDESGIAPLITGEAPYPLYAAVIIVCIGAWTVEYGGKSRRDNFANIMFSTKKGRLQTYFSKLGSVLAVSLLLYAMFSSAELLILLSGRTASCLSLPLCSVGAYANAGIGMTVGEYLIFVCLCRLAAVLLLSAVTLSVSALLKNFAASFCAITGVTFLPTLLYKAGLDAAGYVSFCDFMSVSGMAAFSLGAFMLYAAVFASAAAVLLIISGYMTIGKRRTL